MARICIRVTNNNHPTDAALDALRIQRGDVVDIVRDGHVFSPAELNCGHYRMITVTGATEEDIARLIESGMDGRGELVKRRVYTLDMTALNSPTMRNKTSLTKAQIDSLTLTKA